MARLARCDYFALFTLAYILTNDGTYWRRACTLCNAYTLPSHREMHHGQHSQPTQHDQLSDYAKEVFALASQIMKHCPLCTHGLDAVAIIPLIAFILIFVLAWFSRVRCLCYTWSEDLHIPRIFYIFPIKQAPPLAL